MLKTSIRFLSVIMILVLFLVFTAGCGAKVEKTSGETDGTDDASTEEAAKISEETNDSQQATEEPTYDFGGRKIRYASWWNLEPEEGTSEIADKTIARMNEMQEKYNFTMVYLNIPIADYMENLTASTLAGSPMADILWVESNMFYPTLVANGFLYPVSDLGVFDFQEEKWDQFSLKFGTYDGKIYGMGTGRPQVRSGLFWNKTIFEREALPNLYALQRNYEWTWDKMLEIAKKATKDTNGDGIIDQWGMGGMFSIFSFIYSNNAEAVKIVDNKPVFGMTDPNAIEALQFYQDLINVHKVFELPPDGSAWDYPAQQFHDGKYAMFNYEWWITERFINSMADEYGFVCFPMGPKADEYVSSMMVHNVIVIPSSVEKPEEVAIVFDDMTDPLPGIEEDRWIEGYENQSCDRETLETINMIFDKQLMKYIYWRNFSHLESMTWSRSFLDEIASGQKTPEVAVQEIAPVVEKGFEDIFIK